MLSLPDRCLSFIDFSRRDEMLSSPDRYLSSIDFSPRDEMLSSPGCHCLTGKFCDQEFFWRDPSYPQDPFKFRILLVNKHPREGNYPLGNLLTFLSLSLSSKGLCESP